MREEKKRRLYRIKQVVISSLVAFLILAILVAVTWGRDVPVLETHGLIANQERNLIFITVLLGIFVVLPVFIMLFVIAWKYRATNKKAKYDPELETHLGLEALWWGIPCAIILVLGIITAISTHALDPYKSIESNVKPVKVQVISMNWKWLFIYPDEGVATLNYLNVPEDTPIDLTLTSDAPMNSFWVPALAGQIYTMSGMSTQLHIMADDPGTFNGASANISGDGYADMNFKVNVVTKNAYNDWLKKSRTAADSLTSASYEKLAKPSKKDGEKTYVLYEKGLYNEVVNKYMPMDQGHDMGTMEMSH